MHVFYKDFEERIGNSSYRRRDFSEKVEGLWKSAKQKKIPSYRLSHEWITYGVESDKTVAFNLILEIKEARGPKKKYVTSMLTLLQIQTNLIICLF